MAKIIVAGTIDFAQDHCADVIRGGAEFIAASRKEVGCLAYDWAVDPLVPGRMNVFEAWESEKALGDHFKDASYIAMRDHLGASGITGFDISLYSVNGVEPVYGADGKTRTEIFGVSIA